TCGLSWARGGLERWVRRRRRVCAAALAGVQEFRSWGGLRAPESSAKERGDRGWAHRAQNRMGERRRRTGGELGWSSWTEIGGDVAAGVLRLLDSVDRRVEGLRGSHSGQRGPGVGGGEKNGRWTELTYGGAPGKFRCGW